MPKKTPIPTHMTAAVAAEIRAELGRQDLTQAQLATRLGVSDMWLSTRLRAQVPISVDDLDMIADALDVEIQDLLPDPEVMRRREPWQRRHTRRRKAAITSKEMPQRPPTRTGDERPPTRPIVWAQ